MQLGSYVFFSFGEGWGCLPSFVPKVFLWSSHCVPIMLPEFKSSNSSSFYPISFALSFILVTYISSPKEEIITYLFSGGRPEDSKRKLNFQDSTWHHWPHSSCLIKIDAYLLCVPFLSIF
jgi:hypothetical protein